MKRGLYLFLAAVFALSIAGSAGATVHEIQVGNFFFNPLKTVVNPGDTVRWTLVSGVHTTTSTVDSPKQWDSGTLSGSFDVVFEAADGPGPFPYLCTFHQATMKDTIFMAVPAEPTIYTFDLTGGQTNSCAGNSSTYVGYGMAILSPDSSELSLFVAHNAFNIDSINVGRGAPCVEGPTAFSLDTSAGTGTGTWALTPTDLQDLLDGNLYIVVRSGIQPIGVMRGQIAPEDIHFLFNMSEQWADAGLGTGSFASGFGHAILSGDGSQLSFNVKHDVANPIASHVHLGEQFTSGPPQFTFSSATSPIVEGWALDTSDIKNLFTRDLYLNVHSPSFPNGEIRGQVQKEEVRYAFRLTADEANSGMGTGSNATGFGLIILQANQERAMVIVDHSLDSTITAGHIHLGAPGVSGPPVFTFPFLTSLIDVTWELTPTDFQNLIAGDLYVNLHTSDFPNGEIRGQIIQQAISISTTMSGDESNFCMGNGSDATGEGTVTLKPEGYEIVAYISHNVQNPTMAGWYIGDKCNFGGQMMSIGTNPVDSAMDHVHFYTSMIFLDNNSYLAVRSAAFPDEEIRGQLEDISASCCPGFTGNVNSDANGDVDLSDLIYLVNYLFLGGPGPQCMAAANVTGDNGCSVDLSDLIYLVNFLFLGGPVPVECLPPCL